MFLRVSRHPRCCDPRCAEASWKCLAPVSDRTRWGPGGWVGTVSQPGGIWKVLKGEAAGLTCFLDPGSEEAAQGLSTDGPSPRSAS